MTGIEDHAKKMTLTLISVHFAPKVISHSSSDGDEIMETDEGSACIPGIAMIWRP